MCTAEDAVTQGHTAWRDGCLDAPSSPHTTPPNLGSIWTTNKHTTHEKLVSPQQSRDSWEKALWKRSLAQRTYPLCHGTLHYSWCQDRFTGRGRLAFTCISHTHTTRSYNCFSLFIVTTSHSQVLRERISWVATTRLRLIHVAKIHSVKRNSKTALHFRKHFVNCRISTISSFCFKTNHLMYQTYCNAVNSFSTFLPFFSCRPITYLHLTTSQIIPLALLLPPDTWSCRHQGEGQSLAILIFHHQIT